MMNTSVVLASFLILGLCFCLPEDYLERERLMKKEHRFRSDNSLLEPGLNKWGSAELSSVQDLHDIRRHERAPHLGDFVKDVGSGLKNIGSDIKHGVEHVGSDVIHGVEKVGADVVHVGSHVAHDAVSVGGEIGSFIERGVRSFLEIGKELHTKTVSKLSQLYVLLHRHRSRRTMAVVHFADLPKFTDPLSIDHLDENYKLGNVSFSNVVLQGLSNFKTSKFEINFQKNRAELYLYANEMYLSGKYKLNAILNHHSGDFHLNLYNNITYKESYKYERQGSTFDLVTDDVSFMYGKVDHTFENLGFISKIFEGTLSSALLKEVEKTIQNDISTKMRSMIASKIKTQLFDYENMSVSWSAHGSEGASMSGHVPEEMSVSSQTSEEKPMSEVIGDTMKSIEREIHAKLTSGNYSALTLDDSQMEAVKYGAFSATASSIYLKGLEKFKLDKYSVKTEQDMMTVLFTVKANSVGGGLTVSVKNENKLHAAVQRIFVPFNIEEVRMEFNVTSRMTDEQFGFETAALKIVVENLRIELQENYETSVYELVNSHLPKPLSQFILQSMTALVQSEAARLFSEAKSSYISAIKN